MTTDSKYSPENVLDVLYRIAARSEDCESYNQHIYRLLEEVDETDR